MSPDRLPLATYDPNNIKPGWIALVLVLVLALATFLLWRSMNTQLGRIKAPYKADLVKGAKQPERAEDDVSDPTATPPAPADDEQAPGDDEQAPGDDDGPAPTS